MKKLKLSFEPYTLELKHVFTISSNSRTTTPVVLTKIEYDGFIGYGEASMPPYLGESHESVQKFLSKVNLENFSNPFELETILSFVDSIDTGNTAAKASIDIALHDLIGKLLDQPLYNIWGYDKNRTPKTSFTIGIDSPEMIRKKTIEASGYKVLKVKLGSDDDKLLIQTIREVTDVPICVDANQGWSDLEFAIDFSYWLKENGVIFIEQPMPKDDLDSNSKFTEKSPLPTVADEAIQRLSDVKKCQGVYSGINVKLMKCTGLREAKIMLETAKALGMKTMIGCMTETSCAISAASQLSSLVDWADLDGNLLISNDPYQGVTVNNGRIVLTNHPGIGLKL